MLGAEGEHRNLAVATTLWTGPGDDAVRSAQVSRARMARLQTAQQRLRADRYGEGDEPTSLAEDG
ncbi:hypothetical protein ABZ725_11510 [Streptomyces sp. NPDC006872]|uniref:hypothetical protein n=1 Tax=Streptomyces sp. NPDC006872 TaxID=3155720 RepID=UPI003404ED35